MKWFFGASRCVLNTLFHFSPLVKYACCKTPPRISKAPSCIRLPVRWRRSVTGWSRRRLLKAHVDHRSQVLRIAAAVLSVEFKNARSQRVGFVRIEDHMMQVFEELSATELLTLSVGDMAHKFSCSRRHLNRLFHQHFGCSVASLRMEMRLLKALSLLRDPDVKIINVAEQCGFNHLGLFNACFKKRFGNTPGKWRKGASNGDNPVCDLDVGHPTCPMHANGLCPWTPNTGQPYCNGAKNNLRAKCQVVRTAPANPKLREMILRDIREVSGQMKYKSRPGIALQSSP